MWQRDLRVKIYRQLDNLANKYVVESDQPGRAPSMTLQNLTDQMLAKVGDAQTYGSRPVGAAASVMLTAMLEDAYHPAQQTWIDAVDAHSAYREVIRVSLGITDI